MPVYALLPFLLALWLRVKARVVAWWTGAPAETDGCCKDGVCSLPGAAASSKVSESSPCCANGACEEPAEAAPSSKMTRSSCASGCACEGPVTKSKVLIEWPQATQKVLQVTSEAEWTSLVAQTREGRVMVVDFTASWCGPCKKIMPVLERLCAERNAQGNKVLFVKVDVDELETVMSACSVSAMPTIQVFRGGARVAQTVGANEEILVDMLDQHCR